MSTVNTNNVVLDCANLTASEINGITVNEFESVTANDNKVIISNNSYTDATPQINGLNFVLDSAKDASKAQVNGNTIVISKVKASGITGVNFDGKLQDGKQHFENNTILIGKMDETTIANLELPEGALFTPEDVEVVGPEVIGFKSHAEGSNQYYEGNRLIIDGLVHRGSFYGYRVGGDESTNVYHSNNSISINSGSGFTVIGVMTSLGNIDLQDQSITAKNSELVSVIGLSLANSALISSEAVRQTIELENTNVEGVVVGIFDHTSSDEMIKAGQTTLKLKGSNSVGYALGISRMDLSVGSKNSTVGGAVLTLTNPDPIDEYSAKIASYEGLMTFNDLQMQISSEENLDPSQEYFLIATTDESAKYTFNDLTIKTASTFVEKSKTVDKLEVDKDNPLTTESAVLEGLLETESENIGVEVKATENSKTLSESLLGTVAFINQGAEFIADEGLAAMVDSATIEQVATFGAVHGGTSNYNTGSRVDVDGYTLATGMSYKVSPNWVIGGFIEAGWADSDSHVNGTKGEGEHDYYGIGFATRYSFDSNFYVDGSLRVGQASTEFTGLYAQDSAKYDSDAFYTTAHVGAGYVMPLTDTINLDMYGRYVLSYLDSDKVDLHNKYHDKLDMDSTVTHAVRVGGRLTGSFCSYADWKLGLAYEHVFDGDAESAVNSLNLEVPSLEGDTGVMELGVSMRPSQNSPWRVDIGAKGYAGDREGVTGNATVRYIF